MPSQREMPRAVHHHQTDVSSSGTGSLKVGGWLCPAWI